MRQNKDVGSKADNVEELTLINFMQFRKKEEEFKTTKSQRNRKCLEGNMAMRSPRRNYVKVGYELRQDLK